MIVEFFIPELPPQALNPNGPHGSAFPVAEARRWLRAIVARDAETWRSAGGIEEPFARARVEVTAFVYWRRTGRKPYHASDRYRPFDVPNLVAALKPLYDGLRDARLILDDTAARLVLGDHAIEEVRDYAEEGLRIRVEELPLPGELPANPEHEHP